MVMAPRVAFLLHTPTEKPGSLADFLTARGADARYFRLFDGDRVPRDPREFGLLVVMGGTMNVYQTDEFPFLAEEPALIARAIDAEVPVLGICLGAQLIARACGMPVVKSPQPEVGWYTVTLTPAASEEPLLKGLPPVLTVLQWHEDMAILPSDATLLATSAICPHQAFRVGSALGLQFHLEMTEPLLREWTSEKPQLQPIAEAFSQHGARLTQHAQHIYENLWQLVADS